MQDYFPRIILVSSNTIFNDLFLTGFVSFPKGDESAVNTGTFYLGQGKEPPYLLYSENRETKTGSEVQSLPQYDFTDGFPTELDVEFENSVGKKSPKIKVTATMGHPDDDFPVIYVPRPFLLIDFDKNKVGTGSLVYGLLMDVYQGDQITYNADDPSNPVVYVNSKEQFSNNPVTNMLLFPINMWVPCFTLNLDAQGGKTSKYDFSNAPTFGTFDSGSTGAAHPIHRI